MYSSSQKSEAEILVPASLRRSLRCHFKTASAARITSHESQSFSRWDLCRKLPVQRKDSSRSSPYPLSHPKQLFGALVGAKAIAPTLSDAVAKGVKAGTEKTEKNPSSEQGASDKDPNEKNSGASEK